VNVSSTSDDDAYWRGPDPAGEASHPEPQQPNPGPTYAGPPQAPAPPGTWHPPIVSRPPQPRIMPAQDTEALDEAEGSARTVTYGIGLVAGAIAVILMCLLCARVIF
jgi:hypothetical protein